MRTAFAEEAGTTLLANRGPPGVGDQAGGVQLVVALGPLYKEGRYAEAADRAGPIADAHPEYPGIACNAACVEDLAGRPEQAIDHLRTAIEASEQFREYAREDSDLDAIRNDPRFTELIGRE